MAKVEEKKDDRGIGPVESSEVKTLFEEGFYGFWSSHHGLKAHSIAIPSYSYIEKFRLQISKMVITKFR
jgi:hypothetical protein